jgi:hypothetical protein
MIPTGPALVNATISSLSAVIRPAQGAMERQRNVSWDRFDKQKGSR